MRIEKTIQRKNFTIELDLVDKNCALSALSIVREAHKKHTKKCFQFKRKFPSVSILKRLLAANHTTHGIFLFCAVDAMCFPIKIGECYLVSLLVLRWQCSINFNFASDSY